MDHFLTEEHPYQRKILWRRTAAEDLHPGLHQQKGHQKHGAAD